MKDILTASQEDMAESYKKIMDTQNNIYTNCVMHHKMIENGIINIHGCRHSI